MGVLDGQQESDLIDDIMEHYTILEKNELVIDDINIHDIEKEYLDNLNTRITIERYNKMYLLRLDNIKQLRRLKNLRDLGI
jgi:ribosome-interacting GTPase 1